MKLLMLVSFVVTSSYAFAFKAEFPNVPETTLTPGSLCDRPSKYRYPEQIAYCSRDVSSHQKREIFEDYREVGYRLAPGTRSSYKIDHFIPLCAGGSNEDDNLWPQHKTVYSITDPLEQLGCEKLQQALISQKELVHLIRLVKNDLSKAKTAFKFLISL